MKFLVPLLAILAAAGCVAGGASTKSFGGPNLSCLDRPTAIAIRIENGSRDTNKLRPCG